MAAAYAAWCLRAQGQDWLAALVLAGIALPSLLQAVGRRSVRPEPLRLRMGSDGVLTLRSGGADAAVARLGPGTRRLGPSVFLDLRVAAAGGGRRVGCWLTPFDVAATDLRRLLAALPLCGRVAGA
jgi:hypothetical protein